MSVDTFLSNLLVPMAQGGGGPGAWDGHMMNMPFGGFFMLLFVVDFVFLSYSLFADSPVKGKINPPW